jgi:hypothetical protein
MISYWLKSQLDSIFYQPEYHGKVFSVSEIEYIIDRFGIPDREWETDPISLVINISGLFCYN